jgi:hypothetical protein
METARPVESSPTEEQPVPRPVQLTPPFHKHPLLAGFLALFPGMGNVYNGLYLRGIIFFTVIACLLALGTEGGSHPVLGFVVAFVWIFNVLDSMRQAQLINCGYAQDLGQTDLPKIPKAGQGGLLAGILLIVLGVVASFQLYFGIDLSWMIRYWPLAIIAFGAYLVAAWVREHGRREESEEESAS